MLVAGGAGDPDAFAGHCPEGAFDVLGGVIYEAERWTQFLGPILAAANCRPSAVSRRREWWCSAAGAHARWRARGGDLVLVLETMAKKKALQVRPVQGSRPVAIPALQPRRSKRGMSAKSAELGLLLQRTASLPVVLRRDIAWMAQPALRDSITDLFVSCATAFSFCITPCFADKAPSTIAAHARVRRQVGRAGISCNRRRDRE